LSQIIRLAETLDWSTERVQLCPVCKQVVTARDIYSRGLPVEFRCYECRATRTNPCDHGTTDGTVDCECGMRDVEFLASAARWIDEHEEEERDVLIDSSRVGRWYPDNTHVAKIAIVGRTTWSSYAMPPLRIDRPDWISIGQQMNWFLPHAATTPPARRPIKPGLRRRLIRLTNLTE